MVCLNKRITFRRNPTYQRDCQQILGGLAAGQRTARGLSTHLGLTLERTIRILRDLRSGYLVASADMRVGKAKPFTTWHLTGLGKEKLTQIKEKGE